MQKFDEALRLYLDSNGLKVKDVAQKWNMTTQNVYNWLSGRNAPNYESMVRLQKLTGGAIGIGMFEPAMPPVANRRKAKAK